MNADRTPKLGQFDLVYGPKSAVKKWACIGIFKSAGPHGARDACLKCRQIWGLEIPAVCPMPIKLFDNASEVEECCVVLFCLAVASGGSVGECGRLSPRIIYMSGLLFENNKHTIAKVRENANRHGGKNATITK